MTLIMDLYKKFSINCCHTLKRSYATYSFLPSLINKNEKFKFMDLFEFIQNKNSILYILLIIKHYEELNKKILIKYIFKYCLLQQLIPKNFIKKKYLNIKF